jgi:hypothetical protein
MGFAGSFKVQQDGMLPWPIARQLASNMGTDEKLAERS